MKTDFSRVAYQEARGEVVLLVHKQTNNQVNRDVWVKVWKEAAREVSTLVYEDISSFKERVTNETL
jgi:hypothetical protein